MLWVERVERIRMRVPLSVAVVDLSGCVLGTSAMWGCGALHYMLPATNACACLILLVLFETGSHWHALCRQLIE
jgi:hypothetical protein